MSNIWDADVPWQLLLRFELAGCLCEPQHCLVDEIACCCIQLGTCLPKFTVNQLLKAGILHQLFTLLALVQPCSSLLFSRSS